MRLQGDARGRSQTPCRHGVTANRSRKHHYGKRYSCCLTCFTDLRQHTTKASYWIVSTDLYGTVHPNVAEICTRFPKNRWQKVSIHCCLVKIRSWFTEIDSCWLQSGAINVFQRKRAPQPQTVENGVEKRTHNFEEGYSLLLVCRILSLFVTYQRWLWNGSQVLHIIITWSTAPLSFTEPYSEFQLIVVAVIVRPTALHMCWFQWRSCKNPTHTSSSAPNLLANKFSR